jgi:hypothetical protein
VQVVLNPEMRRSTDHVAERHQGLRQQGGGVGLRGRSDDFHDLARQPVEGFFRGRVGPGRRRGRCGRRGSGGLTERDPGCRLDCLFKAPQKRGGIGDVQRGRVFQAVRHLQFVHLALERKLCQSL